MIIRQRIFTQIVSATADCGADELDDFIFRRTSFQPDKLYAGRDGNYTEEYSTVGGFPHIDFAAVDYGTGAVELHDLIFRRTNFSPDELSADRDDDYIWLDLWIDLAVCARSVTGSLRFGHPHGFVYMYSCFCSTFLSLHHFESVELWMCHRIVIVERRSSELLLTFAIHVAYGALRNMWLDPALLWF